MRNQRGAITVDFIFALILVGAISIVLLSLSFTMFVSLIGQYVAFSTSRSYFAAHTTKARQEDLAQQKYNQLMANPNIRRFFGKGWFNLQYEGSQDFSKDYGSDDPRDTLTGTRLKFEANILGISIPFLGGDSGKFVSSLTSFLGREPSDEECWETIRARWELMKELSPGANSVPTNGGSGGYVPIADNGC